MPAVALDGFSDRSRNTEFQFEPELFASLPQHSGRSGKLDRSHPPPRA